MMDGTLVLKSRLFHDGQFPYFALSSLSEAELMQ